MSTLLVPARLLRLARFVVPAGSSAKIAERLFRRGTAARNAGHHLAAAILYEEALRFTPGLGRIHVQAGHMFKEAGDFDQAAVHYARAQDLMPDNADLALQMGHFHKLAGRPDDAVAAYRRALALQPGWADPADELALLELGREDRLVRDAERAGAAGPDAALDGLAPELLPRAPAEGGRSWRDTLHVAQFGGRRERTRWGTMTVLRGVEAVRGHCISPVPVTDLSVTVDGAVVHSGPVAGFDLPGGGDRRRYPFNLWLDFSGFAPGRYEVELRCTDSRRRVRMFRQTVAVAPPEPESAHPDSDGLVAIDPADPRSVVERVNARASMIRPAERALVPDAPRAVLVQRVDQLGDLVASVAAIRALRGMWPDATLVGLLSPANADLGRALGLFDAVVVADCPEDPTTGRRAMAFDAQQRLRDTLARYRFDLALDMCENGWSRPLLLLSGARFLYGFRAEGAPWLSASVTGVARDPVDGHENAAHAAKMMALVAWLGAIVGRHDAPVPLGPDARARLTGYGIGPHDRFVVLHLGARLVFSRWPGFGALARLLLDQTDLHVVAITDAPVAAGDFVPGHGDTPRLHMVSGRMPFDDFDALLGCAAAFVGNDSGPKHLASLRGTPTVSIHMARLNWDEWGQSSGLVVSRRVPCAGCGIHDVPEDCGQGFACIAHIRADEVFGAVLRLVHPGPAPTPTP